MMIKTIHVVFNAAVTLIVWFAVALLAIVTFHLLAIGGLTVYQLLHS
jgi:hypothetical protein